MLADKKDLNDVVALEGGREYELIFYNFEIKTSFQLKILRGCFSFVFHKHKIMIHTKEFLFSCLFILQMNICFAQNNIVFAGLGINRSANYPLPKVKTDLQKVLIWRDSILQLDSYSDTLGQLNPFTEFLSVNCKSLVFKEMIYLNSLNWHFTNNSDSELWLFEIHFNDKEHLKKAVYMMNKNLPKYFLNDVGTSHYDWFLANDNIYLLRLFHNEGPESDINYLLKAKQEFQQLLEK
jgi:hypothetical protein